MSGDTKRPVIKARKAQVDVLKNARRRQRANSATRRTAAVPATGGKTVTRYPGQGVSITVQIPPLRRPKLESDVSATKRAGKGLRRPLLILPVLLLVGAFVLFGVDSIDPLVASPKKVTGTSVAAAERTEPAYQPLVPSAEKASATKYDAKRDLVSYTTTFSGSRITVSQQPLPASFSKDNDALKKAADSITATQQLDTDNGPLYIATKEDTNDQMALYASQDVLLFIHADRKLDDVSWKSFVELLQAKPWEELL